MTTVFLIILAVLALWMVVGAAAAVCVFYTSVRRPRLPYPVLRTEDADNPVVLSSKAWEPYREVLQEGQHFYCLSDREDVSITSYDGLTLRGTIIMPSVPLRGGLVLVHGFQSSPVLGFGPILPFYLKEGYAVLLPWQRGHGPSEGKYLTYGVRERYDCRDWAAYLSRRLGPEVPVFLDGISMGSATVMMASSLELPGTVRAIVADCGFTSPYAIIRYTMQRRTHLPGWFLESTLLILNLLCRTFAGFGLHEYSSAEALSQTSIPVLFIHGTADRTVPPYMTEENSRACAGPKEVYYVEGAGHAVSYIKDREECEKRLLDFFHRYASNPSDS